MIFLYMYRFEITMVLAAIVPAIILMVQVYRLDRMERESPFLCLQLILLGILSTVGAAILESIGETVVGALFAPGSRVYRILLYFLVVGGAEEGCKYLLLKKRTWRHREFNCQFDGVVYSVFVGLGFALWENLKYIMAYGMQVALVRALTAVPGHACFAVIMGVWYGRAKRIERSGSPALAKTCRTIGLTLAILVHGSYDYIATLAEESKSSLWFYPFILVVFLFCYISSRRAARRDVYFG